MTATGAIDDVVALPRCLRRNLGRNERPAPLPLPLLVLTVLLPFASGYFLSYVFRQINLVIAAPLRTEFDLSAAQLGLMSSMYFLAFALVLLPLGAALDRYGPRTVQSLLMLVAAAGAAVFASADSFVTLMVGRALIGLGVAVALMAGLKAIVLWVRPERMALANGSLVMLGSLGAVAATAPAELLLASLGWRGLFEALAVLCILSALLIYAAVPELDVPEDTRPVATASVGAIYANRRFWRIAPMAASVIAASWSLQGLWAAPWLADVEGLSRPEVLRELLVMAVALSAGGLVLGVGADGLRRRGISSAALLAAVTGVSVAAQLAIVLRLPVPAVLPWATVAVVGASTVLGYAAVTELFPKTSSGRATAALNVLQIAGSFAVQSATGFIVALWPEQDGHPPVIAYQVAFALVLGLQIASLGWFLLRRLGSAPLVLRAHAIHLSDKVHPACLGSMAAYERAVEEWTERVYRARRQVRRWRSMALSAACLTLTLAAAVVDVSVARGTTLVHVTHTANVGATVIADPSVRAALDMLVGIHHAHLSEATGARGGVPW